MEFLRSALEGSFWLSTYGEDYISAFSQQVQKIVMVPWKTLSLRTSLDLQLSYMMKKQLVVLTVSSQKANPIKKRNQLWVKIFSLFLPVVRCFIFACNSVFLCDKRAREMVFWYQNCSDLLWEEIVWNSRLKAENLQKIWDH